MKARERILQVARISPLRGGLVREASVAHFISPCDGVHLGYGPQVAGPAGLPVVFTEQVEPTAFPYFRQALVEHIAHFGFR